MLLVCVCGQQSPTHADTDTYTLKIYPNPWANRCHSDLKQQCTAFFLAGHSDPCTLLWAPNVFVCVSGDSGHRGSVIPRSALTLYQQFSLHFSTKAMSLPVATVTALVFVSDWLFSLFTIGGAASVSCCLDPGHRPSRDDIRLYW